MNNLPERSDPAADWRPWQAAMQLGLAVSDPDWKNWNPSAWSLVEIRREEWGEQTFVVDPSELPPEFNVYGLYWRPWPVVGISFDGP